ncbi:MAG TPA: hydrogenase maturation nickel metallochaperone HypA [Thermodesulfovibrionales bacterium]|nr:hydrogenase maturation nickel metallochaperone HypA [Thermodesulfovibrionales bacterium]
MHETSIALGILDIISDRCIAEGYHSIESVRLRIGRAAGIMPEALLFSFDVAKEGTLAESAKLIIESVSLGGVCSECNAEFEVEEAYVLSCPECGSAAFKIQRGYEMEIVEMDVKEEKHNISP